MAIHALLGKPGAGKSYNAVQRVKDALESGRCVVTSLPLRRDHPTIAAALEAGNLVMMPTASETVEPGKPSFGTWAGWSPAFADASPWARELVDAKTLEKSKAGPLIIVDETSGTLGPMFRASKQRADRNGKKNEDFITLVSHLETHRHYGIDILMIYQDHTQMLQPIKALTERYHTFTNTTEMTKPLRTWSMKTTNRGHATAQATALATAKGQFKAEVFTLYDSHAEGSGKGESVKLDAKGLLKSRPIWLRWWFLLLVAASVALPVFMYRTWKSVKEVSSFDQSALKPIAGAPGARPGPGAAPAAGAPPLPKAPDGVPPSTILVDGAPPVGSIIAGFGRSTIYFQDGGEITTSELVLSGWRVMQSSPCRVALLSNGRENAVRIYRCVKGF